VQERDGSPDRIDLLLLNGSVSRSSQDSYSVEINSSGRGSAEIEDPVVTIPSRFDANTWENEILDDVDNVDTVSSPGTGLIRIIFDAGTYRVSCAAAGLDGAPEFGPDGDGTEDGTEDGTGDDSNEINPTAPGDVRFDGANKDKKSDVELTFVNLDNSDTSIVEARINFYNTNGNSPNNADISATQDGDSEKLLIEGEFKPVGPLNLEADTESTIWLRFDKNVKQGDWFVLTLQFDNGQSGQ